MKRALRYILTIGLTAGLITLLVGWFLSFKFERFLKDEISDKITQASGGFYSLSFDRVSLSLLKGELSVEGLSLKTDSAVLHKLVEEDSLPPLYVDAYIKGIDFDGFKLSMLRKDKKVDFSSFKMNSPKISIVAPYSDKKGKGRNDKSLYDMISPIVSSLAVGEIDLGDADIKYTVLGDKYPMIYSLNNANLKAEGLLIDENSYKNVRPFYCENFSFHSEGKQTLVSNKDFILSVEDISMSTTDSIIKLSGISFDPQKELWMKEGIKQQTAIEGDINSMVISGINLVRDGDSNKLSASSLVVSSPKLEIESVDKKSAGLRKSANNAISAHKLTAPLFGSVLIKHLGIEDMSVCYSDTASGETMKGNIQRVSAADVKLDECSGFGDLEITKTSINVSNKEYAIDFSTNNISVCGVSMEASSLSVGDVDLHTPAIKLAIYNKKKTTEDENPLPIKQKADIYSDISKISENINLAGFNMNNADIELATQNSIANEVINHLDSTSFSLKGLHINSKHRKTSLADIRLSSKNISIPLDYNCYTLGLNSVTLTKSSLLLDGITLKSKYPMLEFAANSPGRQDWFGADCRAIILNGIDIQNYLSSGVLDVSKVAIDNLTLKNFKNKKVPRPPKWMPLIYTGIQQLPLKMKVGLIDVRNLEIDYLELEKKGKEPGLFVLDKMNGTITGFSNIVKDKNQYITVAATGRLMRDGLFSARWDIPVDSTNRYFLLEGKMANFDITAMNQLLVPIAGVKVLSGKVSDFAFKTKASSDSATVDLVMPYQNLRLAIQKDHEGVISDRKFLSDLINIIIKKDNPSNKDKELRHAQVSLERNPYHSTFNYIWQILRPGVAVSAGVSEKTQHAAMRTLGFFEKVKLFFHHEKGKQLLEEDAKANENMIFD